MCWHKGFDGAEGLLIFSPTGGAVRRSIARRLDCSLLGSCRHGLHRDHEVLIGRIRPHHIRLRGVGLCSPWITLDHALGPNEHDVRPRLDPIVVCIWLLSIRVGVRGISAARQHIHDPNLAFRWILCSIQAVAHSSPFWSMHIGSGPGVAGLSGMQVKVLLPLRMVRIFPSGPTATMAASCATAGGAADIALLMSSSSLVWAAV